MADPNLISALRDPEFRANVRQGVTDALNRGGVAAFLGGPVDLATMAMRPFGYNFEAPVGGSEWIGRQMERAGMVSENRNPVAEGLAAFAVPMAMQRGGQALFGLENRVAQNMQQPMTLNAPRYGGQRGALYVTEGLPNKGRELIQTDAEKLAQILRDNNFDVTVQHSGSSAGPSSYIKVFDPSTGRFFTQDIRLSGHSKGAFNSQSVWNVNSSEFDDVLNAALKMREQGGKSVVTRIEEAAQELIKQGVKPRTAYRQAREMIGL